MTSIEADYKCTKINRVVKKQEREFLLPDKKGEYHLFCGYFCQYWAGYDADKLCRCMASMGPCTDGIEYLEEVK
jgi:hypothetical protein